MLLSSVQQQFERLYQLPRHRTIEDFLIDRQTLAALHAERNQLPSAEHCRGVLLLRPQADGLDIAVYLHDQVMRNLAVHDPRTGLHLHNLEDFCTLVEEVSHFLYISWKAACNRQTTRLELELQAEVDKFILCSFYSAVPHTATDPLPLKELLFETYTLPPHLPPHARTRYLIASQLARHYCHALEMRYLQHNRLASLLGDIRQFYRFGQSEKISHIHRSVISH